MEAPSPLGLWLGRRRRTWVAASTELTYPLPWYRMRYYRSASKWPKILEKARSNPANVRLDELAGLVERLGFVRRGGNGSHQLYKHPSPSLPELNLQQGPGGKAKSYQVRQVLDRIDAYGPEVD